MTSTSRKLRKLDKIFFKYKNTCKKECLRKAELNAENLFLKIRECSWNYGLAFPCLEIQQKPDDAYKYTDKGNLVAVISNGTAVLGLGDIGAMSGKPVMEGKGLLFKIYGGIDVFDIEIAEKDPEKFCETVERIAPTFGGINLEDIKAPQCFYIEERLKRTLDIPVMHDDQHGTAIISAAGLKNALEVNGKDIAKVKIVVNGAGAAAISCTKMYVALGAKTENILMLDSKGVITSDRENLTEQKKLFAALSIVGCSPSAKTTLCGCLRAVSYSFWDSLIKIRNSSFLIPN